MSAGINEIMGVLEILSGAFCYTHDVIFAQDLFIHFLEVAMYVALHSVPLDEIFFKTDWEGGKGGVFGDKLEGVQPESINAFVSPEAHDVIYFFTDLWVFPVEVGLFTGK